MIELLDPSNPARQIMDALGHNVRMVQSRGLACVLLKSREGREVFETIEREAQCDFAAIDNVTGNPCDGGDWIMESDNVDIRDFYFYNTDEFSGTFAAHSTRDAGIDEAEVVRRVAAARTEALDAASQEYEAKIRALEVEKQEAATEGKRCQRPHLQLPLRARERTRRPKGS